MVAVIETDALSELIDDARHMPLPKPRGRRVIDLTVPAPRAEIVIPDATITLLEDYELYVG